MKTLNLLLIPALCVLTAACGKYKKEPVSDIDSLRANNKAQKDLGPEQQFKEKQVVVKEYVYVDKPVERIKYQVVEKIVYQTPIDANILRIDFPDNAELTEGKKSVLKFQAKALRNGAKIALSAEGLPDGASFKEVEPRAKAEEASYELSWQPASGTIPVSQLTRAFPITLTARIVDSSNAQEKAALMAVSRQQRLKLLVVADQSAPTEVTVEGLPQVVAEGSVTPFTVLASVPGLDPRSSVRPRLDCFFDRRPLSTGNSFVELDGSRHVVVNASMPVEYVADQRKWRFHMLFDTKNIPVQPLLDRGGNVMPQGDGNRVRMSFKVFNRFGASSPEMLRQLKITFARRGAQ